RGDLYRKRGRRPARLRQGEGGAARADRIELEAERMGAVLSKVHRIGGGSQGEPAEAIGALVSLETLRRNGREPVLAAGPIECRVNRRHRRLVGDPATEQVVAVDIG